jgi:predicted amidohydrolase
MTSVNDLDVNFNTCEKLVREAAQKGCKMIFFPECFAFIGAQPGEAQTIAEPLDGPTLARYCALARREAIWLSLGGFQEQCPGEDRIYNTHVIVDDNGAIRERYRKIHLFDAPFTGLVESKQALPGGEVVSCDSPVGKLGVTICYDMRFPELYQKLAFEHGAHVLLMPSAFAMKTGAAAHWETLLRARAIENQCYVIASAQVSGNSGHSASATAVPPTNHLHTARCMHRHHLQPLQPLQVGQHNHHGNCRQSWGHAMAFDPWGSTLADMGSERTGIAVVRIDLGLVDSTRNNMPMHMHRRYDVYGSGSDGQPGGSKL